MIESILIGYFIILCLTLIHEFGHFIMARFNDVPVSFFAIGFGPSVYDYKDQKGTIWRFNLIPLGGYIEMAENGNETDAMLDMSPWKNIFVSLGGPLVNIIFYLFGAILFYKFIGVETNVHVYQNFSYHMPLSNISSKPNEFLIKKLNPNKQIDESNLKNIFSESIKKSERYNLSFKDSSLFAFYITTNMAKQIIRTFTSLTELKKVKSIIVAQKQIKNLLNNSNSKEVIYKIIMYLLVLSLNLGLFNLLPFVGLDGFWVLMSIINLIFKPKLSTQRKLIPIINYGTYLLFGFMIFLLFRDIYDLILEFFY